MAHSKVPHAGQRYASARKRDRKYRTVSEKELSALRGAVDNRRRSHVSLEEQAHILARIIQANKEFQRTEHGW